MTTVDDVMREAVASLRAPAADAPPFQRVRRRARQRRILPVVVAAALFFAAGAAATSARGTKTRPRVVSAITTTTLRRPTGGYPYDLAGDAPPIMLDHLGTYVWTSPVVLPFVPSAFNWAYEVQPRGAAVVIPRGHNDLVKVRGGYSLRATFEVVQLNGKATLQVISSAKGPDTGPPPGYVAIPNVIGMTRAQASDVLARKQLGVVVATEGSSTAGVVLAQSPCACGNILQHGVITITVGAPQQRPAP